MPKDSGSAAAGAQQEDPEVAKITAELGEKKAKVEDLIAILQVEQTQLRETEQKLLQAKRDAQLRRSQLRQQLLIDTPETSQLAEAEVKTHGTTVEAQSDDFVEPGAQC